MLMSFKCLLCSFMFERNYANAFSKESFKRGFSCSSETPEAIVSDVFVYLGLN